MSISHWGFFPGYWVAKSYVDGYGASYAAWQPCDFDELMQWV
jgi:hypothetical protein